MKRAASIFAYSFVVLNFLAMTVLPVVVYFIVFGPIAGTVSATLFALLWLAIVLWLVRVRRRKFGRFWPTKRNE